jgi:hypothetical protein
MKKKIYFLMYDECIVHGGFFDNFDYYYTVKKVFKDCDVKWRCITNHPREEVIAMLEDKYQDIEPKVYKDIEVVKHRMNTLWRNPLIVDVLICPTNSAIYWFLEHGNIQAAKWYIGLSDWRDIHPKQNKMYKNHYVLGDERVYKYNPDVCNFRPYRKKILFDKYRQEDFFYGKYDYMLNLSLIERRFPKEWIMELFEYFGYGHVSFAAYTGHKNEKYYSYFKDLDRVELIVPPVNDFFSLFNSFIYIPYKDGTDATPRLIPECAYYNKGIEYYDKNISIKSGGYYRYQDTMNDDWTKLWLKEDDELMEIIEKCLNSLT